MMYRLLSVTILPGLLLTVQPAGANDLNKRLKGDFAVSLTSFCSQTLAGFADDGSALSPATPLSRVIEETHTYNGDGTTTRVGRAFQLNSVVTNTGGFPVSESEFTCSGTYQVNEDDSFTETTTCSGSVLSGASAGQTFTQTALTIHGQIRGKTLLFKDTTAMPPSVLTLSVTGNLFRLCGSSGTGVKLPK